MMAVEQLCENSCEVCPVRHMGEWGASAVSTTVSLLNAEAGLFGGETARSRINSMAVDGLRIATELAQPEEAAVQAVTDAVIIQAQGACSNYPKSVINHRRE
jgi:hypothetical protein